MYVCIESDIVLSLQFLPNALNPHTLPTHAYTTSPTHAHTPSPPTHTQPLTRTPSPPMHTQPPQPTHTHTTGRIPSVTWRRRSMQCSLLTSLRASVPCWIPSSSPRYHPLRPLPLCGEICYLNGLYLLIILLLCCVHSTITSSTGFWYRSFSLPLNVRSCALIMSFVILLLFVNVFGTSVVTIKPSSY